MKKIYNVEEAIWLAAALFAYEQYTLKDEVDISDFYIEASELQKLAQLFTEKTVQSARIHQHNNGDHNNCSHRSLRRIERYAGHPLFRVTATGEFGGDKEYPHSLQFDNEVEFKGKVCTIGELKAFVDKEYTAIIDQDMNNIDNNTTIDYLGILEYLENNKGVPYKDPNKPGLSAEDRNRYLEVKSNGQKVVAELKKIHALCRDKFKLEKCEKISWDDGSHTKTKSYLWVPMKYTQYAERRESISLFVELVNEKTAEYRVSLEFKNDKATANDVHTYHKHLDLPLNKDAQLVYVAGSNELGRPDIIDESQNIIIEKVKTKEYNKVQICRHIGKAEFQTNNEIQEEILKSVEAIIPYYEYVLGIKQEEYWPPLDKYNPGLTSEQWIEFLKEDSIKYPSTLVMLKAMLDKGGEATCKDLAAMLGETTSACISRGSYLGKRVKDKFGLPDYIEDDGTVKYYVTCFVERNVENNLYAWKLREELKEALENMDLSSINASTSEVESMEFDKNIILYGPPGTGKTYNSVIYAVAICGEDGTLEEVTKKAQEDYVAVKSRYEQLRKQGRIAFTTFHQSYGYEEFIEGIKPITVDGNVTYDVVPGIFKAFCDGASEEIVEGLPIGENATVWKVTIKDGSLNEVKKDCFENGRIRIGWDQNPSDENGQRCLRNLSQDMEEGDIILSFKTNKTIDAIGVVNSKGYEWLGEKDIYKNSLGVDWLITNIDENIFEINNNKTFTRTTIHKVSGIKPADIVKILKKYSDKYSNVKIKSIDKNFVFVIDEINRGNISKIFGELITLIEGTKRAGMDEAASAILPYSEEAFSVPSNVYILGTMNTADRSIALMDTALRRRFQFVEMMPKSDVLEGIEVQGLNIPKMLDVMNERIKFLYDREHMIGHAFFTGLRKEPTVKKLASIFEKSIIPLLQEYFYEDYQKIQLVLGDNGKGDDEAELKFIKDTKVVAKDIFVGSVEDVIDLPEKKYDINPGALLKIESYKKIGPGL